MFEIARAIQSLATAVMAAVQELRAIRECLSSKQCACGHTKQSPHRVRS